MPVLGDIYGPFHLYTVGKISLKGTNRRYQADESADAKAKINCGQGRVFYVNVFVTSGALVCSRDKRFAVTLRVLKKCLVTH